MILFNTIHPDCFIIIISFSFRNLEFSFGNQQGLVLRLGFQRCLGKLELEVSPSLFGPSG